MFQRWLLNLSTAHTDWKQYRLYFLFKNRNTCVNREVYRFMHSLGEWLNDTKAVQCKTAAIRTLQQYLPHPKLNDFTKSCKWQLWKSLTLHWQRHPKEQCDVMGRNACKSQKRANAKCTYKSMRLSIPKEWHDWPSQNRALAQFQVLSQYSNNQRATM